MTTYPATTIGRAVCTVYDIEEHELRGPRRYRWLNEARATYLACLREFGQSYRYSMPVLARILGRRSHGGIPHLERLWADLDEDRRADLLVRIEAECQREQVPGRHH